MQLYVIVKTQGRWSNGSSETILRKLCDLIDLKDTLIYTQGKPSFIDSKLFISVSHSENLMVMLGQDIRQQTMQSRELSAKIAQDSAVSLFDDPLTAIANAFTLPWDQQALEGVNTQIAATQKAMTNLHTHMPTLTSS